MAPDTARASALAPDCEVMSSVDEDRFVIAAICRDGAWLSMRAEEALDLDGWR
ncbi:DUF7556 family protein [Haloglomus irregulare]|jgi:hypothetical protein|uniref:DUF7556 family protein n=1 Tax=Haloglomus irregulare TaxID=2234134 RepID=UPI00163DD28D|nr:hypothetical protein [Haloglomus irregulare]